MAPSSKVLDSESNNVESTENPYLSIVFRKHRSIKKKLEKILKVEQQQATGKALNEEQCVLLATKNTVERSLADLDAIKASLKEVAKEQLVIQLKIAEKVELLANDKKKDTESINDLITTIENHEIEIKKLKDSIPAISIEQSQSQILITPSSTITAVPNAPTPTVILQLLEVPLKRLLKVLHVCARYEESVGKKIPSTVDFFGKTLLGMTSISKFPDTLEISLRSAGYYLNDSLSSTLDIVRGVSYNEMSLLIDQLAIEMEFTRGIKGLKTELIIDTNDINVSNDIINNGDISDSGDISNRSSDNVPAIDVNASHCGSIDEVITSASRVIEKSTAMLLDSISNIEENVNNEKVDIKGSQKETTKIDVVKHEILEKEVGGRAGEERGNDRDRERRDMEGRGNESKGAGRGRGRYQPSSSVPVIPVVSVISPAPVVAHIPILSPPTSITATPLPVEVVSNVVSIISTSRGEGRGRGKGMGRGRDNYQSTGRGLGRGVSRGDGRGDREYISSARGRGRRLSNTSLLKATENSTVLDATPSATILSSTTSTLPHPINTTLPSPAPSTDVMNIPSSTPTSSAYLGRGRGGDGRGRTEGRGQFTGSRDSLGRGKGRYPNGLNGVIQRNTASLTVSTERATASIIKSPMATHISTPPQSTLLLKPSAAKVTTGTNASPAKTVGAVSISTAIIGTITAGISTGRGSSSGRGDGRGRGYMSSNGRGRNESYNPANRSNNHFLVNPLGNPRAPYGGLPAPRSGSHLMSAQSGSASFTGGHS